jgi:hypothetical protein
LRRSKEVAAAPAEWMPWKYKGASAHVSGAGPPRRTPTLTSLATGCPGATARRGSRQAPLPGPTNPWRGVPWSRGEHARADRRYHAGW